MDRCCECELTKEYLDLGRCPVCGASPLLMSTRTSHAKCSFCKNEFGVPRGLRPLCAEEVDSNQYRVWLGGTVTKEQMLAAAKILECTAAEVYRKFEYGFACFDGVTMKQAYGMRMLFRDTEAKLDIIPPIGNYGRFEECWDIRVE